MQSLGVVYLFPWSPEPHHWGLKQNRCSVTLSSLQPLLLSVAGPYIPQYSFGYWCVWGSPCPLSKATEYRSFSLHQLLCKFLCFSSCTSLAKQHERKKTCWLIKTVLLFRPGLCAKRKRKDQSAGETTLNIQAITSVLWITTSAILHGGYYLI